MTSTVDISPRPVAPAPKVENIPSELTERRQWVCWAYDWREPKRGGEGKWTKEPYRATRAHRRAKTNDPATWSDLAAALRLYEARRDDDGSRRPDGIGYVFAPDDPFVGLDFDNCLDEAGRVLEWAAPILADIWPGCYAEVSPSGRGVKLWTLATLDLSGTRIDTGTKVGGYGVDRAGAIEIYRERRFFTVTGRTWEGPQ